MSIIFPIIETFAPIIPLLACLIVKARGGWVRVLVIYFIVYIMLAGFANFSSLFAKDNIIVYTVINVFTFTCFIVVLNIFVGNKYFQIPSYLLIALVIIFGFYNSIRPGGLKYFDSRTSSACAIILLIYCVYYYWMQIQNPKEFFIYRKPSFWIVTAIFIYWGGNFFLFTNYRDLCLQAERLMFISHKKESNQLSNFAESIWIVVDFLIILTNILFTKAILCIRNKA